MKNLGYPSTKNNRLKIKYQTNPLEKQQGRLKQQGRFFLLNNAKNPLCEGENEM
jgi:hypothetical protein